MAENQETNPPPSWGAHLNPHQRGGGRPYFWVATLPHQPLKFPPKLHQRTYSPGAAGSHRGFGAQPCGGRATRAHRLWDCRGGGRNPPAGAAGPPRWRPAARCWASGCRVPPRPRGGGRALGGARRGAGFPRNWDFASEIKHWEICNTE